MQVKGFCDHPSEGHGIQFAVPVVLNAAGAISAPCPQCGEEMFVLDLAALDAATATTLNELNTCGWFCPDCGYELIRSGGPNARERVDCPNDECTYSATIE